MICNTCIVKQEYLREYFLFTICATSFSHKIFDIYLNSVFSFSNLENCEIGNNVKF